MPIHKLNHLKIKNADRERERKKKSKILQFPFQVFPLVPVPYTLIKPNFRENSQLDNEI